MKARTWIAALSGTSLAITAALVGVSSLSTATADSIVVGGSTATPTAGQIILATNFDSAGNGYVFYVPGTTSPPTWGTLPSSTSGIFTQGLATTTNNGCIMLNPTGTQSAANILNWTASGKAGVQVGYQPGSNGGSIGVSSKGGNATACTQVNQKEGESLTIDLNNPATPLNTSSTPVVALDATFDIEAKGNVVITATPFHQTSAGEVATGETFTLLSGKSQVASPSATQTNCNVTVVADSGPDAGSGDNCPWTITPSIPFDRIVLTTSSPSGAAFSVEGGGDWSNPSQHETVFDIVTNAQGVLACGSSTPTTTSTDGSTSVKVTRVANGDNATCTLIPYDLAADNGVSTFHKPVTGTQSAAQFAVTLTRVLSPSVGWLPSQTTPEVVPNADSPITINWEDPANTTDTLTFCPAGLYTGPDSSGKPTFNYANVPGDMVTGDSVTQYSCIFGETKTLLTDGSGNVVVTDQVYLTGDAKFLT